MIKLFVIEFKFGIPPSYHTSYIYISDAYKLKNKPLGINFVATYKMTNASLFRSEEIAEKILDKYIIPLTIGSMYKITKLYLDEKTVSQLNFVDL